MVFFDMKWYLQTDISRQILKQYIYDSATWQLNDFFSHYRYQYFMVNIYFLWVKYEEEDDSSKEYYKRKHNTIQVKESDSKKKSGKTVSN